MTASEVLMEGVVFSESPRWRDEQVWFSDWGANQVIALDADGSHEVVVTVPSFPMCIDFLPDGSLVVAGHEVVGSGRSRHLGYGWVRRVVSAACCWKRPLASRVFWPAPNFRGIVKTCGSACHALLLARRVADHDDLPPSWPW
jgi:hypothetical protein